MKARWPLWLSVTVWALSSTPSTAGGVPAKNDSPEGLRPGDAVRLSFWREPELNGDYLVDENGVIVIPLLGSRTVTHIAAPELKRSLLDDYRAQLRNQEVQVTLLRRVRVLGAVENPGLYHLDATMTLADVVALAGGPTPNGTIETVGVVRDGERIVTNLGSNTPVAEQVRSGDQIVVLQRGWFSRHGRFVVTSAIAVTGFVVTAMAIRGR